MRITVVNKDTRWAMVIDSSRCIGCHSCSVACKRENKVPLGVFRTWIKSAEKGRFPNVSRHHLPINCNQCEEPVCVSVCPFVIRIGFPGRVPFWAFGCVGHACIFQLSWLFFKFGEAISTLYKHLFVSKLYSFAHLV